MTTSKAPAEMEDRYDEAAIQDVQRLKVPITPSRIHKRTGASVRLDEIRHYPAHRFEIPKIEAGLPGVHRQRSPEEN